jgi:hypothetical protein
MVMVIAALVVSIVVVAYVTHKYYWKQDSEKPATSLTTGRRYEFEVGADLHKEISTKWERPYHTLPVHVDIPRLAKKIAIYSNGVVVHGPPDEDLSASLGSSGGLFPPAPRVESTIRDIMTVLSRLLGEPTEKQDAITTHYSKFFMGGDPSLSLTEFIDNVVGPTSKVVNVLKSCNQSILAPGILKLKVAVGNQYPFKDVRGSWRIDVHVSSEHVTVTHLKRERSFEDDSAEYFEFDWSLKLVFSSDVSRLEDVILHIDELTYGDRMESSKRKKIRDVMNKFSSAKLL